MIITTEEQLREYLCGLRKKNIRKIALDMEGDQGMFHYNPAISIFQCFDGSEAALIDVFMMGKNDTLCEFLTCPDIVKVMFACGNDIFMTQNVLGCTIFPINDIAVAQKILGLPINLANYLNIDKEKKDNFQRANWLARPIKPALLEYAINDVLKLLDIEKNLAAQLSRIGRYDEYVSASCAPSEKNYIVERHEQFKSKFPGYIRLPFEKKKLAAAIWIFRELLGEKLDCPVGYILSKKSMYAALDGANLAASLERELNRGRTQNKKLKIEQIERLLDIAMKSPYIAKIQDTKRRRTKRGSYNKRGGVK